MKRQFRKNNFAVSNLMGYMLSFTIAFILMTSSMLVTNTILNEKTMSVAELQAQSIANQVADAIVDAIAVSQAIGDANYSKTLDVPKGLAGYLGRRNYYVEITESTVFVNTTSGDISKTATNFNTEELDVGISGKAFGSSETLTISYNRPDYVYKIDFGTGSTSDHSPVKSGYYFVSENTTYNGYNRDIPWVYPNYKYRVPIFIKNSVPSNGNRNYQTENLTDYPLQVVLNPSNFDYSKANVSILSSTSALSDFVFHDGDAIYNHRRSGKIVYVKQGSSGDGSHSNPFGSIKGAIDDPNTKDGDTLFIYNGNYGDAIQIDKELNLIGESKTGVIIDNGRAIEVQSDNVFISSLTVERSTTNGGIWIGSGGSGVSNVTIINCDVSGIFSGILIQDSIFCRILNCNMNNTNMHGIWITGSTRNNIIEKCNLYENGRHGISVEGSYNNSIIGCNSYNNGWSGISISGTSRFNIITQCHTYNNGLNDGKDAGIYIIGNCDKNIVRYCNSSYNNGDQSFGLCLDVFAGLENNLVYHNNFINNGASPPYKDNVAGKFGKADAGYPKGGNYYSDLGLNDADGDGITDNSFTWNLGLIDNFPLRNSLNLDRDGLPYSIDRWNPNGNSIIKVNLDIDKNSSKYIYMYYGYDGSLNETAHFHSKGDVALFFEDFSNPISTVKWGLSNDDIKNNISENNDYTTFLYLNGGEYIVANLTLPQPPLPPAGKYHNNSYIIEAKFYVNNGNGSILLMNKESNNYDLTYLISCSEKKSDNLIYLHKNNVGDGDIMIEGVNTSIPPLNHWIYLKTYMLTHRFWKAGGNFIDLDFYQYNAEIRSYEGHLIYSDSTGDLSKEPLLSGKIGIASGLISNTIADNISIDWIRVLNVTTNITPIVTFKSLESLNTGWNINSSVFFPSSNDTGFDSSKPSKILRDYINFNKTSKYTFVFDRLDVLEDYILTITIGNSSGPSFSDDSTIQIRDSQNNPIKEIVLPSTAKGVYKTVWHTFTVPIDAIQGRQKNKVYLYFDIDKNDNLAINSITLEKGSAKGIEIFEGEGGE